MADLEINQLVGRKVPEKYLREILNKFLKLFKDKDKVKGAEISVAIVGNGVIKKFNRIYRGENKPTDVLSFNYSGKKSIVGEIIISYPQAKKQAKKYNHSLKKELRLLFVHGLLHLAGFDHKTLKDKAVMSRKEEEILGGGLCERK